MIGRSAWTLAPVGASSSIPASARMARAERDLVAHRPVEEHRLGVLEEQADVGAEAAMSPPRVRVHDDAPANGGGGRGDTDDETIPLGQGDRVAEPHLSPRGVSRGHSVLAQQAHVRHRLAGAGEELELSVVA